MRTIVCYGFICAQTHDFRNRTMLIILPECHRKWRCSYLSTINNICARLDNTARDKGPHPESVTGADGRWATSCCLHLRTTCRACPLLLLRLLLSNKLTSSRRVGSAVLRVFVGGSDGSYRARSSGEVGATAGSAWDTFCCCCAERDTASPIPIPRPTAEAWRPACTSVLAIISGACLSVSVYLLCLAGLASRLSGGSPRARGGGAGGLRA